MHSNWLRMFNKIFCIKFVSKQTNKIIIFSSILTAGADGDIRLYPGLYDDEILSVTLASKITALDIKVCLGYFYHIMGYDIFLPN